MPLADVARRARHAAALTCLLLITACGEHPHDTGGTAANPTGSGDQGGDPATNAHADHEPATHGIEPGVAHAATGVVRSVDRMAATAVIHHDPVLSIGMPEMTMTFRLADPNFASQLQPGQRISFEFMVKDGVVITTLR